MFEQHSALAPFRPSPGVAVQVRGPQLCIAELLGWELAQLTAWRAGRERFLRWLGESFGAAPPEALYRGVTHGTNRLVRLTPEQYWWLGSTAGALQELRGTLAPQAGAFTELTDARVRLSVSGAAARELLAGCIAIDLHPAVFGVGHSAQTGLHHTGVFLERVAEDTYEFLVPRTFAASIWEYLVDAALPHGVEPA